MLNYVCAKDAGCGLWWGMGQIGPHKVYAGWYTLLDDNMWARRFTTAEEAVSEVKRLFNVGPAALPEELLRESELLRAA